jgi:UDPglucose--hexose-1-phosphate uridylyltransferase
MPDYRQNILTGHWVIIAEDRATRPGAFVATANTTDDESTCPFCEGNEHETPHETFAVRAAGTEPDAPGWQVRMVPNRYPAVGAYKDRGPVDDATWTDPFDSSDILSSRPAVGTHEVIIESPRHIRSLAELSSDEMLCVVTSYRDRMRQLAARGDLACLLLFKNSGVGAGASLSHVHSQLIGLPQVLPQIEARLARSRTHYEKFGRLLLDDWLEKEVSDGSRVVRRTGNVVAVCPWASRFPAETWLVPQDGPACFEQLSDTEISDVASSLHDTLRRIDAATDGGPLNFLLRNPPASQSADNDCRWYLEILPRLTNPGGFEWSTDMHINPVSPERAAACLREGRALV